MKSVIPFCFAIVASLLLTLCGHPASLANEFEDPLKQDGILQKIADPVDQLIDLRWEESRLTVNVIDGFEELDLVVDSIREVVGYGGGSSWDSGDEYTSEIYSDKLQGFVRREKVKRKIVDTISLNEVKAPFRSLYVSQNEDGTLAININASQSAYMLRIRQYPDGRIIVQELKGTEVHSRQATDFDLFLQNHQTYVGQRLFPMFEHFGLGKLISPYDDDISQRVVEMMVPWSEGDLDKVAQLTDDLNSNEYQLRETATNRIRDSYADNEMLLTRVVLDQSFPPEIRSRLRTIIHDKAAPETLDEMEFLRKMSVATNSSYLIWLLESQSNLEQRNFIVDRVAKLVGDLQLGQDNTQSLVASHAMSSFALGTLREPADDLAGVEPLKEKGEIQKLADNIGELVRLTLADQQVLVDREHWKAPFGGREIKDIAEEIQKQVDKSHLPKSWFEPGGAYSISSASHPQVLFERMEEAAGSESGYSHGYYGYYDDSQDSDMNREFETEKLKARLVMNGGKRKDRKAGKGPFSLSIRELKSPERELLVREEKPGKIQIRIVSEKSNMIIQLLQFEEEVVLQDVRGPKIIALKAGSFEQIVDENRKYFDDEFFPLLRHLGVKIDEAFAPVDETTETGS